MRGRTGGGAIWLAYVDLRIPVSKELTRRCRAAGERTSTEVAELAAFLLDRTHYSHSTMRTAAAAHRRLGQVHRQLAAADGTAGPADSEEAGGMRVVPSRQGHQVSSFPTRRPSGSAARFMENDAPTSSHAEKSRSLIEKVGKGVLCTMHQELE